MYPCSQAPAWIAHGGVGIVAAHGGVGNLPAHGGVGTVPAHGVVSPSAGSVGTNNREIGLIRGSMQRSPPFQQAPNT